MTNTLTVTVTVRVPAGMNAEETCAEIRRSIGFGSPVVTIVATVTALRGPQHVSLASRPDDTGRELPGPERAA